jgi:hypothetical protein
MSGPIVRKYGFPNFEKIFGERPLEHGADEGSDTQTTPTPAAESKSKTKKGKSSTPKASKAAPKKKSS